MVLLKDEPDIIKKLRNEEEKGLLKNDSTLIYEDTEEEKGDQSNIISQSFKKPQQDIDNIEKTKDNRIDFNKLINVLPDPVIIVDSKGKILDMNKKLTETLGYTYEEYIGKNVFKTDLASKKTKAILIKNLVKRMAGVKLKPYEIELTAKNKNKIPFEINATKIDYFGTTGDLIVFRETSEIKKREKESENILNAAADGIRIIDRNFKIKKVNETFAEMTGVSSDKQIGATCRDIFRSKYCKTKDCSLVKCLKNNKPYQREQIMTCKDGSKIPVLLKVTPLKDEQGNITGIIEDYRDISSVKKTEQKVVENEKKFRQFFENSPDYCYMVGLEGKIIDINKSAIEILNIKNKEEAIGKQIIPLVYNDEEKAKQLVKKWKKEGFLENEEIKIKSKDGIRTVLLSVDNVEDKNGKVLYSVLMQKDLTNLLKTEKELKNKVDELERYKKLTVGRELKMIELKNQMKELEQKCAEEKKIG
ncbi:PAS domain S-box protein [Candidatus Woesearchaeota archaeon]|nr:PAS domain S-box protein [Candidatus Woesearchaeota archaeon]